MIDGQSFVLVACIWFCFISLSSSFQLNVYTIYGQCVRTEYTEYFTLRIKLRRHARLPFFLSLAIVSFVSKWREGAIFLFLDDFFFSFSMCMYALVKHISFGSHEKYNGRAKQTHSIYIQCNGLRSLVVISIWFRSHILLLCLLALCFFSLSLRSCVF